MKAIISRSNISGKAAAPASKSYTIRALMCAGLAQGQSLVRHPLKSDDTLAAAGVLSRAGVVISEEKSDWRVDGGHLKAPDRELFCRESAATLRFMTAIAALLPGEVRLTFGPTLAKRPVTPLLEAMKQLGIDCRLDEGAVVVKGGRLEGGAVRVPGDLSSQYISALLLIAPRAEKGLVIELEAPPRSRPYILMTLECLRHFGCGCYGLRRPDQAAGSAPELPAGDLPGGGRLVHRHRTCWRWGNVGRDAVTNLNAESLQRDRVILSLLQKMGPAFRSAAAR
jgi:3-phosphoshikimate 1-carboxyvinyltransferase